jgi:hypothetical protein
MKKAFIAAVGIASVEARSVTLSSSDLTKGGRGLDNIEGEWSQKLNFLGNDATLTGNYDRNEREDFLSEASLSGAFDKVKYELRKKFGGQTSLSLETEASGAVLEVEANDADGLTSVTAKKGAKLGGQECDFEVSHDAKDNGSKIKLSSVLGGGVTASGIVSMDKSGDTSAATEVEYDASLGDGRSLHAEFNPNDGSGEVEYTDTATIATATLTAKMPLGGKPSVSVKRSWSF